MTALTPKRIAFAEAVASGKSQSDAYREAFKPKKMTQKSVHERASQVASNSQVKEKIAELRIPIALKAQMTLESHLEDLQRLRNMAAKERQYGPAITAEIARGKASGVHVERIDAKLSGNLTIQLVNFADIPRDTDTE